MNKHFLITLLVVAGMTATVQADHPGTLIINGDDKNHGFGLNLQDGVSADVLNLNVGLRAPNHSDEEFENGKNTKYKSKQSIENCNCEALDARLTQLEKNKDTTYFLHLGIRDQEYKKKRQLYRDCGCPTRQRRSK